MPSLTFASHPTSVPAPAPTANPTPSQEQQDEPIVVLGRGFVEVGASFEQGVLLLEERTGDQAHIIAIITRDGQQRLQALLKQD